MENEKVLDNIQDEEQPAKKGGGRGFHTNIFTLVLSVLVATFLWVYVMSVDAPNSEQTFYGVKVSVNNIDKLNATSGLSIVSESENIFVDVVLQGKKSVLGKITSEDIKAYVDASALTEAGSYELEIKYMPFPGGATFVKASSTSVSLVADETASVRVPIKVVFKDCVIPTGYSLGESVLNTEYVNVTGAKTDVEKIESAVITISAGTMVKSVTVMDAIPVLCDKSGNEISGEYVNYEKEYVDVYVPVYLKKDVKIEVGYQYGLFNDKNTTVTLSPAKITVYGDAEKVAAIGDSIFVGKINEKSTSNQFFFDITKNMLGEGVSVVTGTSRVIATVAHSALEVTEFLVEAENFKVNNPHGVSYSVGQDGVVIKLRCPTDKMAYLDNENIEVVLDLSNVGGTGGSFDVVLKIVFKGELKDVAYELSTYSVKITT